MSKFEDVTLSTGESLTKHEYEIVSLAPIKRSEGDITVVSNVGTLSEKEDYDFISVGDIINLSNNTEILVISKGDTNTVNFNNISDYSINTFEIYSWSNKIAIAKQEIEREIKIILNRKFDQNDYDEDLINMINNAEDFGLTSDYLTLSMIYQDIMISSDSSDIYSKKSDLYFKKYKNALAQNLEMVDIDTNFDDTTDVENVKFYQSGRILR